MRWSVVALTMLMACRDKEVALEETGTPPDTTPETGTPLDTADTGGDDTGSDTTEEPCVAELVDHVPRDGTAGIRIDSAITLTLSDVDDSAELTLATQDGKPIAGSGAWDDAGTTYTFTPATYLDPEERYTASATWCTGEAEFTFLTADPDDIPPDASTIEGSTFYADLDQATWSQPPGIGLLLGQFGLVGLLFELQAVDETAETLDIELGLSQYYSGNQDYCVETTELVADYSLAPWFSYDVERMELAYDEYVIPLLDLRVQGRFTYEGDEVESLSILATLDAREVLDLFEKKLNIDDPDEVCDLISGLGGACVPCDDGAAYCAAVEAGEMEAETMPEPVETVEVTNCHEECPASADNPDCE